MVPRPAAKLAPQLAPLLPPIGRSCAIELQTTERGPKSTKIRCLATMPFLVHAPGPVWTTLYKTHLPYFRNCWLNQ